MLARLEALPGVAGARAEGSGRHLLVEVSAGAEPAAVLAAVSAALGGEVRRLAEPEAEAQLAARGRGDPWFSASEAPALSYLEGRILAVRVSSELRARLGLSAAEVALLAEAVRLEIFATLERVHREGGRRSGTWFYGAWPELAARIAARFPGGLGAAPPEPLQVALRALFSAP